MTRKQRAEVTKKLNKFVKDLKKVQTVQELGALFLQLEAINPDRDSDYPEIVRILGNKIRIEMDAEQSRERQVIYLMIAGLLGATLVMDSLDDLRKKFNSILDDDPFNTDWKQTKK